MADNVTWVGATTGSNSVHPEWLVRRQPKAPWQEIMDGSVGQLPQIPLGTAAMPAVVGRLTGSDSIVVRKLDPVLLALLAFLPIPADAKALLVAVAKNPDDVVSRNALADLLAENGHDDVAAAVRTL